MAKHICGHCAREFDAAGDQRRDCCPGCRELGHKGNPQKCPACKADQPSMSPHAEARSANKNRPRPPVEKAQDATVMQPVGQCIYTRQLLERLRKAEELILAGQMQMTDFTRFVDTKRIVFGVDEGESRFLVSVEFPDR